MESNDSMTQDIKQPVIEANKAAIMPKAVEQHSKYLEQVGQQ